MRRYFFSFMNSLKLRWKLLVVVLPLVVVPIFVVGGVIGYISYQQANLGITQTSKDDLQHMADFTVDLLDAHYHQFHDTPPGTSPAEKKAFLDLKERIKSKRVGKTGYIYCITSAGTFTIHPDEEGKNFIDATDSDGNRFIREMCVNKSGWIRYPWKGAHDAAPRMKIVCYE